MASLMKKWMKFRGSTVKERQMSSEQKQFWTNVLAPKNETTTMSHFSAASIQTDVVKIKSLTDTHKHTHSLSLSLSLTHTLLSPSLSLIGDTTHSLILSLSHIHLLPQSHYCLFSLSFFLFLFFSPYMPSSFFSQFPHTQAHTLTLARTSTQTRTHTHTCACTHSHTRANFNTDTHTHTHTCACTHTSPTDTLRRFLIFYNFRSKNFSSCTSLFQRLWSEVCCIKKLY